jgi:outer membrane protein assembly factor BamD (BamD/ComL family)
VGNYFQTKEQAEEALRRVKEVLKSYQEEING